MTLLHASNVTFSGNTVTVSLSGVTDVQVLTVSANGVSNGNTLGASNDVRVGFLVADVNGDGAVNVADAYLTRSYSGQPLGAGNFRGDVNTDGALNAADATMVRNNSGHGF